MNIYLNLSIIKNSSNSVDLRDNIRYLYPKKNTIMDGEFTKILFSKNNITMNGLYLYLPLSIDSNNRNNYNKNEIYTRYKEGEAIVDENYSYTEFYRGEKYLGNMLYDMKKDTKQNTDISKLSINKELVKKYSEKLQIMRDFVNKDYLEK